MRLTDSCDINSGTIRYNVADRTRADAEKTAWSQVINAANAWARAHGLINFSVDLGSISYNLVAAG